MFQGRDIATLPPYAVANLGVGFVPDNRRIFPTLTVKQNLELAKKRGNRSHGGWTLESIYQHFPKLAGDGRSEGRGAEWRRATDAHHRAHVDGEPGPGAVWTSRPRASRRSW